MVASAKPIAKSMLVLMVRGLNSGLQFPYAQFPCANLRGDQMFHLFWKAVGRLQRYGFRVIELTCGGLAANRQLFRLHAPRKSKELVYKTTNPHYTDPQDLFFFVDPPTPFKDHKKWLCKQKQASMGKHVPMLQVYGCSYCTNVYSQNAPSCSFIIPLAGNTLSNCLWRAERMFRVFLLSPS